MEIKKDVTTEGKVWIAGAGPGDSELLTVKVRALIDRVDVIAYDALVSAEILSLIPVETKRINVGKRASNHVVPQIEINKILLEEAKAGNQVLRLKGGDPFVFGRGGEEIDLLLEAGIPFEIVPGITSAIAVPAYAGIPITHRDYTSSFHVITGRAKGGKDLEIDYEALVCMDATLVFLMGITAMDEICSKLIQAGMRKDMPAAVLEKGTTAKQRRVISSVEHLWRDAVEAKIQTPAIIMVGKVCQLANEFHWAEDRPLGGKQVLITRPKQLCSALAEKLRGLGASVIELPTIITKPLVPNVLLQQVLADMEQREQEEWLVFTSPTGVEIFFEQLTSLQFDLRRITRNPKLKFAVIGAGTKRALEKRGLFADVMPSVYSAHALGVVLGEVVKEEAYVTILRAQEGSKQLIPPLLEKGISCVDVPLYETICRADGFLKERIREMFEQKEIDWVTFTSASTVTGFTKTMGEIDYSSIRAMCIGEQTAEEALKYGMQVTVAQEATMDSMVERMLWENTLQKE